MENYFNQNFQKNCISGTLNHDHELKMFIKIYLIHFDFNFRIFPIINYLINYR